VRDYKRHGLRTPSRGQQWVKVDNNYLLLSIATGVILGVAAAH
jgi:Ni/Co efflux regulator RcnB